MNPGTGRPPRKAPSRALVIGLLGGVGSGKSTVARLFQEEGARVLDADQAAREVLERPEVARKVEELLGPGLLDPEGKIDRKVLADKVFRSEEARRTLESLVHPQVLAWLEGRLAELRREPGIVILDVPLLLETGLDRECDHLVFLEVPEEERERRTLQRGWEPGERKRREKTQLPLETKRGRADYILLNSGTLEETRRQILDLLGCWRA